MGITKGSLPRSKFGLKYPWDSHHLYIRSSEEKSKDFAISGDVNAPFSDAATAKNLGLIRVKRQWEKGKQRRRWEKRRGLNL